MANIVWDDDRSDKVTIGGGPWSRVAVERFFGGAAIFPSSADTPAGYGTLRINFEGTQISLFGNTPGPDASQSAFVSIDGGKPYEAFYTDPAPPSSRQWYQSPVLTDTTHSINVTSIAGTSLDYMVVVAGQNTPLTGERLIVDDDDSSITYEGTWTRREGRYSSSDQPSDGLSYGNATHQSSSKGSKATFLFSGSKLAVYSLFDWSHLGSVTVSYTVDSTSKSIEHAVTPSTAQFRAGVLQRENTLLFESDDTLAPGEHSLTMEILASTNQTPFVLDYILYQPSFRTLASKPVIQSSKSSSITSSLSTTSSPSTSTPVPSPNSNVSPETGTDKPTPVGAIVGGVVGGVAGIALLLIIFLLRKRFRRRVFSPEISEPLGRGNPSVNPFTSTAPSTAATIGAGSMHRRKFSAPTSETQPHSASDPENDTSSSVLVVEAQRPDMSQHKSSLSLSRPFTPALAPLRYEPLQQQDNGTTSGGGGGSRGIVPGTGVFRSRMQRLQDLVTELNREISDGGGDDVRVAELRGRIAELAREDAEMNARAEMERRQSAATTIPPPYEPRMT